MTFIDTKSNKAKIFNLLCKESPLTAKQVFEIVQSNRWNMTYQAVHKDLQALAKEKLVKKKKKQYAPNWDTFEKVKKKIIELERRNQE